MKKLFMLFVLTLVLGGTAAVRAAAVNFAVKADYLGDPHYTTALTKQTDLNQIVKLTSVTSDKTVKIALFSDGDATTGYWTVTKAPTTRYYSAYTECLIGYEYNVGVKLAYPWVQVTVNGSHDVK